MERAVRLFLLSFLILFLELTLIRWIGANIRLVSYFSNLVLLGSFLGIGVGLLLTQSKRNLFLLFPFALLTVILAVAAFRIEVHIPSSDVLFFSHGKAFPLEPEFLLPAIFLLVALVFVPLSQSLGRVFRTFPPLTAYSIDIGGALLGIGAFSLFSFFSLPAYVWFWVVGSTFFLLMPKDRTWRFILASFVLVLVAGIPFLVRQTSIWSPYYKIVVRQIEEGAYNVLANNISHQIITSYKDRENFYFAPYKHVEGSDYERVLIIGAGTGVDTATVLAYVPNVKEVDVVEIDPKLLELGKRLNPDRPFVDPRVHIVIDDGRSFLERTDKKYDLIIYALTDSLTLAPRSANIRLESFLFTKEAFRLVKEHLAKDGLFVLYNYYRRDWLIDKIALMLKDVFGKPPHVISYGTALKAATLFAGPKTDVLDPSIKTHSTHASLSKATDDWPFLYLEKREIPAFYLRFLLLLVLVSVGIILSVRKKHPLHTKFFFFGAAFLLLETKSLVTFSLLFGVTWVVNALVFAGILMMVLLATVVSMKLTISSRVLYVCLFGTLLLSYIVPTSLFFELPIVSRFVAATIFFFAPILFANLLFAQFFKLAKQSTAAFGANMLGAVFGGFAEYGSLMFGYKALILLVIFFYAASLLGRQGESL